MVDYVKRKHKVDGVRVDTNTGKVVESDIYKSIKHVSVQDGYLCAFSVLIPRNVSGISHTNYQLPSKHGAAGSRIMNPSTTQGDMAIVNELISFKPDDACVEREDFALLGLSRLFKHELLIRV